MISRPATIINTLFCEVVIAPSYNNEALELLKSKKNRIILVQKYAEFSTTIERSCLNGKLIQQRDESIEKIETFELKTNVSPTCNGIRFSFCLLGIIYLSHK